VPARAARERVERAAARPERHRRGPPKASPKTKTLILAKSARRFTALGLGALRAAHALLSSSYIIFFGGERSVGHIQRDIVQSKTAIYLRGAVWLSGQESRSKRDEAEITQEAFCDSSLKM
jgi:hypothetical protein